MHISLLPLGLEHKPLCTRVARSTPADPLRSQHCHSATGNCLHLRLLRGGPGVLVNKEADLLARSTHLVMEWEQEE